jgi:hypothetical protein
MEGKIEDLFRVEMLPYQPEGAGRPPMTTGPSSQSRRSPPRHLLPHGGNQQKKIQLARTQCSDPLSP